jgi:hypothetical protein
LKKRSKKLLLLGAQPSAAAPQGEQFFGSFFQKRTACFSSRPIGTFIKATWILYAGARYSWGFAGQHPPEAVILLRAR